MKNLIMSFLVMAVFIQIGCTTSPKKQEITLNCQYSQAIEFKKDQKLTFPDFALTYLREVDPEVGVEVRSTASIRNRFFLVQYNDGTQEEIEITHGQLPPSPYHLKNKYGNFTINTFTSSKKERLFDTKIEVVKNK
jgi:hypothetical protein